MGKAARKLNKALQKNKAADTAKEIQQYRERVSKLINEGKFSSAVDVLAEAATKKLKDVELMYDTAYCYFMVGDYERAGRWINNVLTVSPDNKATRVLLARLCLLQDREDDGLAVFDFVLDRWRYQLGEAELQEISETLEYYGREMPEKIRANYPHVAALLEENDALGTPEEAEPVQEAAGNSALDAVREKLAALKKLTEKAETKQEVVAEPAVAPAPQPATAAETLARLKDKLAALKAKTAATSSNGAAADPSPEGITSSTSFAGPPSPEGKVVAESENAPASEQTAILEPMDDEADELEPEEITQAESGNAEDDGELPKSVEEMNAQAEAKRDEVMAMSLSLEEKIGALNNFAGAYFFAGAYPAAEVLLQAALQIDPKRSETIRNLALLLKESGDQEAALQCAARLPIMDFALLSLLRNKE